KELQAIRHYLDGTSFLSILLPRAVSQPSLERDLAALREVVGAELGLAVPGRDTEEVGLAVLPAAVDREPELRKLLLRPELPQLDVRRQAANQDHGVHARRRPRGR